MIRSILYQSTAQTEFPSNVDHDILEVSWRHNTEMGVTGYLLRTRSKYFQLLEGADDVLDDLLAIIGKDNRHTEIQILSDNTSSQRCFTDWAMGYHLVTENERDEFDGWLKDGDEFNSSMIAYMQLMATERQARSPMRSKAK
jgi:hypothetical protein